MPTAEELEQYYRGLYSATPVDTSYNTLDNVVNLQLSTTNTKTDRLASRTAAKQNKFQQDTLLGMKDADSFITSNLGKTRSTVGPNSFAYDAVELAHYGKQPIDEINSNKYKAGQLAQVALLLNKPVDQVTNQDIIDVGNWQQIQKVADLARTNGESRWKAPLIRDAVQTDLTGTTVNEFGVPIEAPLNIPVQSQAFNDLSYGRETAQFSNLANENVTQMAALDPSQNFLTHKAGIYLNKEATQEQTREEMLADIRSINPGGNGYVENVIKGAGSGVLTTGAGIADAFTTLGANIVHSTAKGLGLGEHYTEEESQIASTFFDKYKDSEWADKTSGYDRAPSEKLVESALSNFKEGNYFTGIADAFQAGPDVFFQSLPYMIVAATGTGFVAMVGSEFNDSVEAYQKNNEGAEPSVVDLARMASVDTLKVGLERIPFMTAVKGKSATIEAMTKLMNSVPSSKKIAFGKEMAKKIGTVGLNIGEEASQEGAQYAMDYFNREYGTDADKGFNWDEMYKAQIAGGAAGGFAGSAGVATKDVQKGLEALADRGDTKRRGKKTSSSEGSENESSDPSEDELATAKTHFSNLSTKLNNDTVSNEDLHTLDSLEEIIARQPDVKKRDANLVKINAIKQQMAARLETQDIDEDPIMFGSSNDATQEQQEDTIEYIENILDATEGKLSETLDDKLRKVAAANGVSEDVFKTTKDAWAVEQEVVGSKRGYRTQSRVLGNLLRAATPDLKQIKSLVNRMNDFKDSQQRQADSVANRIKEVEAEVNAYNNDTTNTVPKPDSQYTAVIKQKASDQKFVINVRDIDGKYVIDDEAYNRVNIKRHNVDMITKELSKHGKKLKDKAGLDVEDTGIATSSFSVDTSIAKSAKAINRVVSDNAYYKAHGINKVITTNKEVLDGKWSESGYGKGRSENINTTDYTKDDSVLLSVSYKTKGKEIESEMSNKDSVLRKQLDAAVKAGATIIFDTSLEKSARLQLITQLTKFGREYSGIIKEDGAKGKRKATFGNEFKPKTEADVINKKRRAAIKTHNEDVATKEDSIAEAAIAYSKNEDVNLDKYKDIIESDFKGDETKFKAHLAARNEKLVQQVKKLAKAFEELRLKAKEDPTIKDEMDKLVKELKEVPKSILNIAKDEIKAEKASEITTENLLQKYKEAKEVSEEAAEAVLKDVEDHSIIKYVLQNSPSKGIENVYTYTDGKGVNRVALSKEKADKLTAEGTQVTELVIDINKVVNISGPNFINSIETSKMGTEVHNYTKWFKEALLEALASKKDILKKSGIKTKPYTITLADNPARGLIFSDIKGEELNDNVALAMQLTIDEFMAYNSRMLADGYKSDADLAQMFGISEFGVTNVLRKAMDGKGMLKKSLANSLGKATLSRLGIKPNKDIDMNTFDRLAADIGNSTINGMLEVGILEDSEMTSVEYNKAFGRVEGISNVNATIKFIKFNESNGTTQELAEDAKERFEAIHELVADDVTFRKEPRKKPIKNSSRANKVAKSVIGSTTSNKVEKMMEKLRASKWRPDVTNIKRVLANKNLKEILGYTEDTSKMSQYDAVGQESINRDILKSIDELEKLVADYKTNGDIELFFDWFYSSNGRYMMDSNTLNPQTDKLHRFLIQPAATLLEYTKAKDGKLTVDGKDITGEFDYAVAQGLGFDVDKKGSKIIRAIGEALRSKNITKEIAKSLEANTEWVLETSTGPVKLHADHISHAYQALDALEKYHKGGKFSTALTAETDAVTSGFALKLMQLPILKDMFKWLNKVGVFRKSDISGLNADGYSMNDILSQNSFFDSYQTLAKETKVSAEDTAKTFGKKRKEYKSTFVAGIWSAIEPALPTFDGTEVSSELRTLFKDPFMTFNYSAGMQSIRQSLSNVLTNKLVTKMIKAEEGSVDYTLLKTLAAHVGVKPTELQAKLNMDPLYTIKLKKNSKISIETLLNEYVDASYGESVQNIMETEFKEFIDAQKNINDAFKAMFQLFNKEYTDEMAAVHKAKGFITDADKLEIIGKLRHKFPSIKGPLQDKEDKSDYVGIYKTTNATPNSTSERLKPAQTYLADGTTDKIRHEIKVFEEAISAGAVVPIHFIDGALMGKIITELNGDFTAIHDAIMPPLNKLNESANKYNEEYIKVGMEYSVVAEIQAQLESAMKDVNLDDEYYNDFYRKEKKADVNRREFIQSTLTNFKELAATVETGRKDIAAEIDKGVMAGHMASLEDGVYIHNGTKEDFSRPSEETKEEVGTISATEAEIAAIQKATRLDRETVIEIINENNEKVIKCKG